MNLRAWLTQADIPVIRKIWERFYKKEFDLPVGPSMLAVRVVEEDGQAVGFGAIIMNFEVMMLVDQTKSIKVRGEILGQLIEGVKAEMEEKGIPAVHAFTDSRFAEVLKKHYGFQACAGEALILVRE